MAQPEFAGTNRDRNVPAGRCSGRTYSERLRLAFSRSRSFLWFALALAAVCVRPDLAEVKKLHQESESNTKPECIFGHSCQVLALAVRAARGYFALPLVGGIHEGVVFSNRTRRTVLDKLAAMLQALEIPASGLLVADAYYASAKIIRPLLRAGWRRVFRTPARNGLRRHSIENRGCIYPPPR